MAVPTNTRETYGAIGIREDLSNIIYNISPEETPFMSAIGKSTADNTFFEWQTDSLTSAAANRVAEGDDASVIAVSEPTRRGNYTQISTKAVQTSGTAEAVDFAGRKSSQAYQMAKRAKELKLDMELMLLSNTGRAAGSSGSARATGGVGAWVQSNLENGTATSSAADYGITAPTAGTDKACAESDIRSLMTTCWTAGAKPTVIMVDGSIKKKVSELSQSVSELRTTANDKSPAYVVAAVDIYVSDFGNLQIVPNRHMPAKTAYFLDYEYWDIAYLRPFASHDLAKTGDSMSKQLIVEYGLRARNEAANGSILGWDPAL